MKKVKSNVEKVNSSSSTELRNFKLSQSHAEYAEWLKNIPTAEEEFPITDLSNYIGKDVDIAYAPHHGFRRVHILDAYKTSLGIWYIDYNTYRNKHDSDFTARSWQELWSNVADTPSQENYSLNFVPDKVTARFFDPTRPLLEPEDLYFEKLSSYEFKDYDRVRVVSDVNMPYAFNIGDICIITDIDHPLEVEVYNTTQDFMGAISPDCLEHIASIDDIFPYPKIEVSEISREVGKSYLFMFIADTARVNPNPPALGLAVMTSRVTPEGRIYYASTENKVVRGDIYNKPISEIVERLKAKLEGEEDYRDYSPAQLRHMGPFTGIYDLNDSYIPEEDMYFESSIESEELPPYRQLSYKELKNRKGEHTVLLKTTRPNAPEVVWSVVDIEYVENLIPGRPGFTIGYHENSSYADHELTWKDAIDKLTITATAKFFEYRSQFESVIKRKVESGKWVVYDLDSLFAPDREDMYFEAQEHLDIDDYVVFTEGIMTGVVGKIVEENERTNIYTIDISAMRSQYLPINSTKIMKAPEEVPYEEITDIELKRNAVVLKQSTSGFERAHVLSYDGENYTIIPFSHRSHLTIPTDMPWYEALWDTNDQRLAASRSTHMSREELHKYRWYDVSIFVPPQGTPIDEDMYFEKLSSQGFQDFDKVRVINTEGAEGAVSVGDEGIITEVESPDDYALYVYNINQQARVSMLPESVEQIATIESLFPYTEVDTQAIYNAQEGESFLLVHLTQSVTYPYAPVMILKVATASTEGDHLSYILSSELRLTKDFYVAAIEELVDILKKEVEQGGHERSTPRYIADYEYEKIYSLKPFEPEREDMYFLSKLSSEGTHTYHVGDKALYSFDPDNSIYERCTVTAVDGQAVQVTFEDGVMLEVQASELQPTTPPEKTEPPFKELTLDELMSMQSADVLVNAIWDDSPNYWQKWHIEEFTTSKGPGFKITAYYSSEEYKNDDIWESAWAAAIDSTISEGGYHYISQEALKAETVVQQQRYWDINSPFHVEPEDMYFEKLSSYPFKMWDKVRITSTEGVEHAFRVGEEAIVTRPEEDSYGTIGVYDLKGINRPVPPENLEHVASLDDIFPYPRVEMSDIATAEGGRAYLFVHATGNAITGIPMLAMRIITSRKDLLKVNYAASEFDYASGDIYNKPIPEIIEELKKSAGGPGGTLEWMQAQKYTAIYDLTPFQPDMEDMYFEASDASFRIGDLVRVDDPRLSEENSTGRIYDVLGGFANVALPNNDLTYKSLAELEHVDDPARPSLTKLPVSEINETPQRVLLEHIYGEQVYGGYAVKLSYYVNEMWRENGKILYRLCYKDKKGRETPYSTNYEDVIYDAIYPCTLPQGVSEESPEAIEQRVEDGRWTLYAIGVVPEGEDLYFEKLSSTEVFRKGDLVKVTSSDPNSPDVEGRVREVYQEYGEEKVMVLLSSRGEIAVRPENLTHILGPGTPEDYPRLQIADITETPRKVLVEYNTDSRMGAEYSIMDICREGDVIYGRKYSRKPGSMEGEFNVSYKELLELNRYPSKRRYREGTVEEITRGLATGLITYYDIFPYQPIDEDMYFEKLSSTEVFRKGDKVEVTLGRSTFIGRVNEVYTDYGEERASVALQQPTPGGRWLVAVLTSQIKHIPDPERPTEYTRLEFSDLSTEEPTKVLLEYTFKGVNVPPQPIEFAVADIDILDGNICTYFYFPTPEKAGRYTTTDYREAVEKFIYRTDIGFDQDTRAEEYINEGNWTLYDITPFQPDREDMYFESSTDEPPYKRLTYQELSNGETWEVLMYDMSLESEFEKSETYAWGHYRFKLHPRRNLLHASTFDEMAYRDRDNYERGGMPTWEEASERLTREGEWTQTSTAFMQDAMRAETLKLYDMNTPLQLDTEDMYFESAPLTFTDSVKSSHDGQTDHILTALTSEGEVAGYIEYSVYYEEPSIQMIQVPEHLRRQGYGKALVHELQSMFPETEIDWGMKTTDGQALYDSLNIEEVPTRYQRSYKRFDNLKKELDRLQAIADDFYAQKEHTPEEREQFNYEMRRFNDIDHRIYVMEKELWDKRPTKKIIRDTSATLPIDENMYFESATETDMPPYQEITLEDIKNMGRAEVLVNSGDPGKRAWQLWSIVYRDSPEPGGTASITRYATGPEESWYKSVYYSKTWQELIAKGIPEDAPIISDFEFLVGLAEEAHMRFFDISSPERTPIDEDMYFEKLSSEEEALPYPEVTLEDFIAHKDETFSVLRKSTFSWGGELWSRQDITYVDDLPVRHVPGVLRTPYFDTKNKNSRGITWQEAENTLVDRGNTVEVSLTDFRNAAMECRAKFYNINESTYIPEEDMYFEKLSSEAEPPYPKLTAEELKERGTQRVLMRRGMLGHNPIWLIADMEYFTELPVDPVCPGFGFRYCRNAEGKDYEYTWREAIDNLTEAVSYDPELVTLRMLSGRVESDSWAFYSLPEYIPEEDMYFEAQSPAPPELVRIPVESFKHLQNDTDIWVRDPQKGWILGRAWNVEYENSKRSFPYWESYTLPAMEWSSVAEPWKRTFEEAEKSHWLTNLPKTQHNIRLVSDDREYYYATPPQIDTEDMYFESESLPPYAKILPEQIDTDKEVWHLLIKEAGGWAKLDVYVFPRKVGESIDKADAIFSISPAGNTHYATTWEQALTFKVSPKYEGPKPSFHLENLQDDLSGYARAIYDLDASLETVEREDMYFEAAADNPPYREIALTDMIGKHKEFHILLAHTIGGVTTWSIVDMSYFPAENGAPAGFDMSYKESSRAARDYEATWQEAVDYLELPTFLDNIDHFPVNFIQGKLDKGVWKFYNLDDPTPPIDEDMYFESEEVLSVGERVRFIDSPTVAPKFRNQYATVLDIKPIEEQEEGETIPPETLYRVEIENFEFKIWARESSLEKLPEREDMYFESEGDYPPYRELTFEDLLKGKHHTLLKSKYSGEDPAWAIWDIMPLPQGNSFEVTSYYDAIGAYRTRSTWQDAVEVLTNPSRVRGDKQGLLVVKDRIERGIYTFYNLNEPIDIREQDTEDMYFEASSEYTPLPGHKVEITEGERKGKVGIVKVTSPNGVGNVWVDTADGDLLDSPAQFLKWLPDKAGEENLVRITTDDLTDIPKQVILRTCEWEYGTPLTNFAVLSMRKSKGRVYWQHYYSGSESFSSWATAKTPDKALSMAKYLPPEGDEGEMSYYTVPNLQSRLKGGDWTLYEVPFQPDTEDMYFEASSDYPEILTGNTVEITEGTWKGHTGTAMIPSIATNITVMFSDGTKEWIPVAYLTTLPEKDGEENLVRLSASDITETPRTVIERRGNFTAKRPQAEYHVYSVKREGDQILFTPYFNATKTILAIAMTPARAIAMAEYLPPQDVEHSYVHDVSQVEAEVRLGKVGFYDFPFHPDTEDMYFEAEKQSVVNPEIPYDVIQPEELELGEIRHTLIYDWSDGQYWNGWLFCASKREVEKYRLIVFIPEKTKYWQRAVEEFTPPPPKVGGNSYPMSASQISDKYVFYDLDRPFIPDREDMYFEKLSSEEAIPYKKVENAEELMELGRVVALNRTNENMYQKFSIEYKDTLYNGTEPGFNLKSYKNPVRSTEYSWEGALQNQVEPAGDWIITVGEFQTMLKWSDFYLVDSQTPIDEDMYFEKLSSREAYTLTPMTLEEFFSELLEEPGTTLTVVLRVHRIAPTWYKIMVHKENDNFKGDFYSTPSGRITMSTKEEAAEMSLLVEEETEYDVSSLIHNAAEIYRYTQGEPISQEDMYFEN